MLIQRMYMSDHVENQFFPLSYQEQILDSYDLITSVFGEIGGQNNLSYELDGSLPVIVGSPLDLQTRFKDFITVLVKGKPMNHLSVYVSHIKDPKYWIFTFLVKMGIGDTRRGKEMVLDVDPVKTSLSIPKRGGDCYPIYLL